MVQPILAKPSVSFVSNNSTYVAMYLDDAVVPEDSGRVVIGDKTIIISGKSSVLYVLNDRAKLIGKINLPVRMTNPEAIAIKNVSKEGVYTIGIWDDHKKMVFEVALKKVAEPTGIQLDDSIPVKSYRFETIKKIESMAYQPDGTMVFIDRQKKGEPSLGDGTIYKIEKPSTSATNKLSQTGNVGNVKATDMYPIPGGFAVLTENGIIEIKEKDKKFMPVGFISTRETKNVESLSVTATTKADGKIELVVHEGKDLKGLSEPYIVKE